MAELNSKITLENKVKDKTEILSELNKNVPRETDLPVY